MKLIKTANQNIQNSNHKTQSETPRKKKFPFNIVHIDFMVTDIKEHEEKEHKKNHEIINHSNSRTKDY